jgi:hypothetical protein
MRSLVYCLEAVVPRSRVLGCALVFPRDRALHSRRWRLTAGLVALALVVSLLAVVQFPKPAAAAPAEAKHPCPAQLPDEAAAVVTARMCGGPVLVAGATTETDLLYVNADGTRTLEHSYGAVRVRQDDGSWKPVDTTLRLNADGTVAPATAATPMTFSGGGAGSLVQMSRGAKKLEVGAPVALPAPTLDGSTATYSDVFPGVDLRLTAHAEGYDEVLVVKDRTAAGNPALADLRFALSGSGLTPKVAANGTLQAVDGAGAAVFSGSTPQMWDSSGSPASGGEGKRTAMPTALAGAGELSVTPVQPILDDPDTVFPVYIDPGYTASRLNWTWVDSGSPNTSNWNSTDNARVGTADSGASKRRSLFQMNTSAINGKHIISATFKANEVWSWSCTAKPVELWLTGGISSATTWNNQPAWDTKESTVTTAHGYTSSCPSAVVSFDATAAVTRAAASGWPNLTLGLRATSETDNTQWKRFDNNPTMSITYNTVPNTPSNLSMSPYSGGYTSSLQATLSATFSDPDGGSLTAQFEVASADYTTVVAYTYSSLTGVPSGTLKSWTQNTPRANGSTYHWRARGYDGTDYSAWSSYYTFTVDTTAPGTPTVTSTSHPSESSWYAATSFAGTVTASDSGGISGWAVKFDRVADTSAGTTVTQTSSSVSATGLADGVNYLHVAAVDTAGNWSGTKHFKIQVDATKPAAPTNVTSSTHPVSTTWYDSRTITASWTAPPDLSGISQYAVAVDQTATTVPSTSTGLQTATSTTKTVAADGVWYLHVRAKDNAGNWSDAAAHFKFQVDTTIPPAPAVTSSTHPDQNAAYQSGAFSASWTAPAGGASGYSVVLDASPATVPGTTVTTTGTTHSATVADGTWYLHVRPKDDAGNWGTTAHFRFTVDTTAPVAPQVSSTDFPTGEWVDKANTAGVVTLDPLSSADVVEFRYSLDGAASVDVAANPGQPLDLELVPTADGPHSLTVQAVDLAGNISATTTYTFMIGTGAGTLAAPVTGDITAAKTILRATGHASTGAVSYEWRRADTDTWTLIPATDVTYTQGGGAVTWPVPTTGGGAYPELNWDVDKTINDAETGPDPLDGPLQVRANFTGTGYGPSVASKITFDKNSASAASAQVGPGSVNLITGNFSTSSADASAMGLGVSRTFSTRLPGGADAMFGPGWVSSVVVAEGSSPYTKLEVFGSLVQVGLPDGNVLGFTATGDGTAFDPPTGSEGVTVTLAKGTDALSADDDTYTVADISGNRVELIRAAGDPAGQFHPASVVAAGSGATTTISWERAAVDGVALVRPTRVLAPVPSDVSCSTLVRGCRALTFTYATTTTAAGSEWGDYAGRVTQISFTAWDPDAAAMRTVMVAAYAYDASGRLRGQWDPRLDYYTTGTPPTTAHMWTTYDYDSNGILPR